MLTVYKQQIRGIGYTAKVVTDIDSEDADHYNYNYKKREYSTKFE